MHANVGLADRLSRIAIGLVLLWLTMNGVIGWWGDLGLPLAVTGAIGMCPLYRLLGIRTSQS